MVRQTTEKAPHTVNYSEPSASMLVIARKLESQYITVIGSTHATDPNPPDFYEGNRIIDQWLCSSEGQTRLMLHEGRTKGFGATIEDTFTYHFGESGLIQYRAHHAGVECISGEPSITNEVGGALDTFGLNLASSFLGMRELPWWSSSTLEPLDYLQNQFQKYKDLFDPKEAYTAFKSDFETHYGVELAVENVTEAILKDCLAITKEPGYPGQNRTAWLAELARVAEHAQNTRTRSFGRNIITAANEGKSVLAWLGQLHVEKLAPKLAKIGDEYKYE